MKKDFCKLCQKTPTQTIRGIKSNSQPCQTTEIRKLISSIDLATISSIKLRSAQYKSSFKCPKFTFPGECGNLTTNILFTFLIKKEIARL